MYTYQCIIHIEWEDKNPPESLSFIQPLMAIKKKIDRMGGQEPP